MALVVMASGLVFTCAACKKKKAPRSNPDVSVGENFYPEVVFTIKDMYGNSIDDAHHDQLLGAVVRPLRQRDAGTGKTV